MAGAREALTAVLAPLGYPIVSSRLPEQINAPQLAIAIDTVEPAGVGRQRRWSMSVYVLTPLKEPESADDALEVVLTQVLDALDASQPLNWAGVERGTAAETFSSFKITVWVIIREE